MSTPSRTTARAAAVAALLAVLTFAATFTTATAATQERAAGTSSTATGWSPDYPLSEN
ncbi:hypothetical protein [Streptomyces sp. NPDC048606]|uniref:hypothetical protein n=1 Tax=Streptomyces sp. NPDC048606 TaxID=3154726 RepID=UPI00342C32A6